MREITTHKIENHNDKLQVFVLDEPGPGGASHSYAISPSVGNALGVRIDFQKGPLGEFPNGVTHETMLSILIDRLESFQRGNFPCVENDKALGHLRAAQSLLLERTKERIARGVEGKLQA